MQTNSLGYCHLPSSPSSPIDEKKSMYRYILYEKVSLQSTLFNGSFVPTFFPFPEIFFSHFKGSMERCRKDVARVTRSGDLLDFGQLLNAFSYT